MCLQKWYDQQQKGGRIHMQLFSPHFLFLYVSTFFVYLYVDYTSARNIAVWRITNASILSRWHKFIINSFDKCIMLHFAHIVHVWIPYDSQNKLITFLNNINWLFSVIGTQCFFCLNSLSHEVHLNNI